MVNSELIADTEFTDENISLGTRYYYTVRAVDADGTESVDAEAVSIVPSAPATSLAGAASGGGGGGGGCFISSTQTAFNRDIMQGLAILGFIVMVWKLIIRIKALGLWRQPSSTIKWTMAQQACRIWKVNYQGMEQDLHKLM
jgi:hypothetical protein